MSEAEVSFTLNAQAQSLPDPSNIRRWGYNANAQCLLCTKPAATAKHVINCCSVALRQGRYLWRHNNVLKAIAPDLIGLIAKENRTPPSPPRCIRFVPAGAAHPRRVLNPGPLPLLRKATDWQLQIDLGDNPAFPAGIVSTEVRPDIVILVLFHKNSHLG